MDIFNNTNGQTHRPKTTGSNVVGRGKKALSWIRPATFSLCWVPEQSDEGRNIILPNKLAKLGAGKDRSP